MTEDTKEQGQEEELPRLEPFKFEIFIGGPGKQKGVKLRVELDTPSSAISLVPIISVVGWPHVTGIQVTRELTNEVICRVPIMDIMRKLAPEINRAAGGTAIPMIPLAGDKDLSALADGTKGIRDVIGGDRTKPPTKPGDEK